MRHTITIASNPRIILVFLIAVALPVGVVLLAIFFHVFLGIIVTAVAGYIAYHLLKFGISNFKSWIETSDEGITIRIGNDEPQHLTWEEITHAGAVTQPKSKDQLFVYAEERDRLFAIPSEYSRFEELKQRIARSLGDMTVFEEVELEATASISDYLREKVGVTEEPTDPPSEA